MEGFLTECIAELIKVNTDVAEVLARHVNLYFTCKPEYQSYHFCKLMDAVDLLEKAKVITPYEKIVFMDAVKGRRCNR